ncbi:MAG: hypothetical protein WBM90_10590, partial [Acidimicrobiia bacterium]
IFIGVLALVTMRDSREAAVSAAAVETSAAFVDAWGHSDPTAYSYLTDDASVSIYPTIGADQLDAEMRLRQAMGWVYEVDGCRVITVYKFEDETRAVLCAVTHHSAWSDGLGVEPITTARVTLNVLGDRVRAAKLGFNRFQYDSEIKEWLTTNHPEDVDLMYQYPNDPTPSLSDEAIELWRRYTQEFVAENGG